MFGIFAMFCLVTIVIVLSVVIYYIFYSIRMNRKIQNGDTASKRMIDIPKVMQTMLAKILKSIQYIKIVNILISQMRNYYGEMVLLVVLMIMVNFHRLLIMQTNVKV